MRLVELPTRTKHCGIRADIDTVQYENQDLTVHQPGLFLTEARRHGGIR